jgi:hypothetical protein
MKKAGKIVRDIEQLVLLFERHCADKNTLTELLALASDAKSWPNAHSLFQRIRQKSLQAQRNSDGLKRCQYDFEEKCAKTLYNLSLSSAPFDSDSPYWIIPGALALARRLGLPDEAILSIVRVE